MLVFGEHIVSGLEAIVALAEDLEAAERSPFDGLLFDFGFPSLWDDPPLERAEFDAHVNALRAIPFQTLTTHFHAFTVEHPYGEPIDLFDDTRFAQFTVNVRTAAGIVRDAGLRGIFLDTQSYHRDIWRYPADAILPFSEYEALFKQRGAEFMSALLDAHPDLTVLLTLGYSEVFRAACLAGEPLEATRYGLLPAFLDGMATARADRRTAAVIVDGFLPAYPTRDPRAFRLYVDLIRFDWAAIVDHWVPNVQTHTFPPAPATDPADGLVTWPASPALLCPEETLRKLHRNLSVGFGILPEFGAFEAGTFQHDPARFDENHLTPDELTAVVRAALSYADGYVWIWSQFAHFRPSKSADSLPMPDEYIEAIARARRR